MDTFTKLPVFRSHAVNANGCAYELVATEYLSHLTQAFANNLSFKIHLVNLAKVQKQLQRLQKTAARSIKRK